MGEGGEWERVKVPIAGTTPNCPNLGRACANRGAVKEQETGWQICISFKVRHAKGCHLDGGKRGSLGNPDSGWKARTRSRKRPAYVPTMTISLCPF